MRLLKIIILILLIAATGAVLYLNTYSLQIAQSKLTGMSHVQLVPAFPHLKLERPIDFQDPADGLGFFYVAEQGGILRRFKNSPEVRESEIVLDLKSKVFFDQGETGLLGFAFDPDFKKNGYFYVDYTAPNPLRTVIERYQLLPGGKTKTNESLILLEVPQPYANHNGGQIGFGPDGYLYVAMGDGGAGGDPHGHGQNLQSLLGKILRIDVRKNSLKKPYAIPPDNPFSNIPTNASFSKNKPNGLPEIYAWGLRNPWRFSWDSKKRLWVGDVGQNQYEEIHLVEKGKNYGWNIMEASHCFSPEKDCNTTNLEIPIFEYPRRFGSCVIGGFVYEGTEIPELKGRYVFSDFVSRLIFILSKDLKNPVRAQLLLETPGQITSFGIDARKELYAMDILGRIFRFTRKP